ncbi:hypothetical protein LXL04_037945 [Taraxacum kok-saghyz]
MMRRHRGFVAICFLKPADNETSTVFLVQMQTLVFKPLLTFLHQKKTSAALIINWLNKKILSPFFFSIVISSVSTIAPAARRRLIPLPAPPPIIGDSVQAGASSSGRRFSPSLQAPIFNFRPDSPDFFTTNTEACEHNGYLLISCNKGLYQM